MEENNQQQTVNLTVYGYKDPFINRPVISIYYNDVLIGDVTQNEIRVFEVTVPGKLMFKFKHLTCQLTVTSAIGVQVDFNRISGGFLVQQWLPTVSKEQEVYNRKPQKEKKKIDLLGFIKKHKKKLIICLSVLTALIALFLIADAINDAIMTEKTRAYLDGNIFLSGEYRVDDAAYVFAFDGDHVRREEWCFDEIGRSLDDPASVYKLDASLFENIAQLKYKDGNHWYTLLYVDVQADGTVFPHSDYYAWRQITMEELETMRALAACTHSFRETVLVRATCTTYGEALKTCTICGYETKAQLDRKDHNYVNKVCTVCGDDINIKYSTEKPNTFTVYKGEIRHKNSQIITASPSGDKFSVTFKPVCSGCLAIGPTSQRIEIDVYHPYSKQYDCPYCGDWSVVEVQAGSLLN